MTNELMTSSSIMFSTSYPSLHFHSKTEHQAQFQGGKSPLPNFIKDKNLNQLKYLYQFQFNS
jgi:hypothetical protein